MTRTGDTLRKHLKRDSSQDRFAIPVISSKGADGQQTIEANPDEVWVPKQQYTPDNNLLDKAGFLLVAFGHDTSSARLTAVASDNMYVGNGWMPAHHLDPSKAKAAAVFINSTVGRVFLMGVPGKKLSFPAFPPAVWRSLPMPDLEDTTISAKLSACWEETRYEIVPQFRDGYTHIRRRWDEAVCDALGWDIDEIAELGELLAREPRVSGVAYGQWKA